jgi:hypothetical protein
MIRRIRRRRRRSARPVWFAFALFLLAGALVYRAFPTHRRVAQPEFFRVPAAALEVPVRPALDRRLSRPVYPYSVIRGGAYSVAELDAALDNDPVASAHYAGFHRDGLRMTYARGPLLMYASYRMGGSVYWTSHPVHVAAGESLITDGTSLARARCGNQLSDSPREPVTRMEPIDREMETPETLDLNPHINSDINPAAAADTPALDRLLALRPRIAPPVSALAFEIFPPAPLSAAPASLGSAGISPFQGAAFWPFGARSSLSPSAPVTSPPAEYSPPPAGGPGESSLQLTLQTFQQKPASTTVLQVPQVNAPALPGVITGIEGFPGDDPRDPATPPNHPAPPATTSSGLPPVTGNPEPGEPSLPSASPGESVPVTHVVPEPFAGALLCAGVALLYIAKRRRAL